jgi:hypothetical protein
LYFLPEAHGHGSLRPTLPRLDGSLELRAGRVPRMRPMSSS